jgi:hypothetical protein
MPVDDVASSRILDAYIEALDGNRQYFLASDIQEFEAWRWIDYWRPVHEVVYFKRNVYRRALCELVPLMFPELAQDRRIVNPSACKAGQ